MRKEIVMRLLNQRLIVSFLGRGSCKTPIESGRRGRRPSMDYGKPPFIALEGWRPRRPQRFCERLGILILFWFSLAYSASGGDSPGAGMSNREKLLPRGSYNLSGGVSDVSFPCPEEILEKLEKVKTFEEALTLYTKTNMNRQVAGATVVLKSRSRPLFSQTSKTGADGRYVFENLNEDLYEISCEVSVTHSNQRKTAKARVPFRSSDRRSVWLDLRTDLVTVKGKITDTTGKPLGGIKIRCEPDICNVGSEMLLRYPVRCSVSEADGTYEISDISPPDFQTVAYYLQGSPINLDGTTPIFANLVVDEPPSVPHAEGIKRIPLISEDNIKQARRFIERMNQLNPGIMDCSDKVDHETIVIPQSKGNVITGVDIVLKKADKAVK